MHSFFIFHSIISIAHFLLGIPGVQGLDFRCIFFGIRGVRSFCPYHVSSCSTFICRPSFFGSEFLLPVHLNLWTIHSLYDMSTHAPFIYLYFIDSVQPAFFRT